jgi:hypothetical protein
MGQSTAFNLYSPTKRPPERPLAFLDTPYEHQERGVHREHPNPDVREVVRRLVLLHVLGVEL